jgi:hypothetical protein
MVSRGKSMESRARRHIYSHTDILSVPPINQPNVQRHQRRRRRRRRRRVCVRARVRVGPPLKALRQAQQGADAAHVHDRVWRVMCAFFGLCFQRAVGRRGWGLVYIYVVRALKDSTHQTCCKPTLLLFPNPHPNSKPNAAHDACAEACQRAVCSNPHSVPAWNEACLKRCTAECLKGRAGGG